MQHLALGKDTFYIKSRLIAHAPTVVFIHALGADQRIFDAVASGLADENVGSLRYDLRGHGLSDLGAPPTHIDDHVNDLAALLDAADIGQATLCGVSVGGMIALGLWRRRPDLVENLILSSTGAKIGATEAWNQRIAAVREGGTAAVAESVLQRWFSAEEYARGGGNVALCRNMLLHARDAGYIATCVALRDSDLTEVARTVDVPCLCIAGDVDSSTPPALVRELHESIPGSKFTLLHGAGHLPPLQRADAFTQEIQDFLG